MDNIRLGFKARASILSISNKSKDHVSSKSVSDSEKAFFHLLATPLRITRDKNQEDIALKHALHAWLGGRFPAPPYPHGLK